VDERSERIAKRFEWPVLVAALLVIPVIVIEQSDVREPLDTIAMVANWLIWLVFAAELVTLLAVVPQKGRWLRQHPVEVAVVVLTPPFLPASLQAARVLRLLRLLRLVRLAPLVRRMFSVEGLRYAGLLLVLTVLGGGAAFAAAEDRSSWDGVYWCLTTMTTVGSDIHAHTTSGRIISMAVVIVGITFVAFFTGAIARRFIEPAFEEVEAEVEEAERDLMTKVRAISQQLRELEEALERRL
jgi:voltage-gated potassium channel